MAVSGAMWLALGEQLGLAVSGAVWPACSLLVLRTFQALCPVGTLQGSCP